MISVIGTYLPVWGDDARRVPGGDEDALTVAVAAGRAALSAGDVDVDRVVLVSRSLPLLDGGNAAALLAGLGLSSDTPVVEQVGGAAAVLDALLDARPGTMVVGADIEGAAGGGAAVLGSEGIDLRPAGRVVRSLPVTAADTHGGRHDYSDPRLQRERGLLESVRRLGDLPKPVAIAGVSRKDAKGLCAGDPPILPTVGASSVFFALAALGSTSGTLFAIDQACATAAEISGGSAPVVVRDERRARPMPRLTPHDGPPIPISLPAYDRAFDAKLRWAASTRQSTGVLDFPPRPVGAVRDAAGEVVLTALPRSGTVYTTATIHVPVPGKATPYQLVITELDEVDVRALVQVTGAPPSSVAIGDRGSLVLRRVEVRAGIPDYGYAFRPDEHDDSTAAQGKDKQ